MKPEEAQDRTEKRWTALTTATTLDGIPLCGWCLFADEVKSDFNLSTCHFCPIVVVFGDSCMNIEEFEKWQKVFLGEEESFDLARKILTLLTTHRQQLIAAGEEL